MVCERKSKGSFTLSKCIAKLLVKLLAAATVNAPALVNLGNTTYRTNYISVTSPKVVNISAAPVAVVGGFTQYITAM